MNTYRCENCDKEFKAYPQSHGTGRRFCSKACFGEWWHKKNKQLAKARIRACKNCGKKFLKKPNNAGLFCSHACWVKWKKTHRIIRIRICEACGKEFEYKGYCNNPKKSDRKGKFCSKECFQKIHRKPKVIAICPVCGEKYEQSNIRKKFCSSKCYFISKGKPEITFGQGCKTILRKHHEEMKHDPERLTTKFMAKIVGCACPKVKESA